MILAALPFPPVPQTPELDRTSHPTGLWAFADEAVRS